MSKKITFDSFDKAIEYIVTLLSTNEIELIKNSNPEGLHLGLARWIQSEFVNSNETNISELTSKIIIEEIYDNTSDETYIHPDNITGFIIDALITKIKKDN